MAPSEGLCNCSFEVRQMRPWLSVWAEGWAGTLSRDQLGDEDSPTLLRVAFGRNMTSRLLWRSFATWIQSLSSVIEGREAQQINTETTKGWVGWEWLSGKEFTGKSGVTGDVGLILWSERSPGVGNSNPLQYSCLENPMDRGAWQATVHRVAKSQTRVKHLASTHASPGAEWCWGQQGGLGWWVGF